MKKNKVKIGLLALNVLVIAGLAGLSFVLYNKNRDLNEVLGLSTEEKNTRLIKEIDTVYDLPDETPVVAIVTDPEKFKSDYPTFANAEGGDYLLFFRKARLNVLYRQKDKRVVQTANVNVPITVEIVGSEAALPAIEEKLKQFGNQVSVKKTVNNEITQNFVFDIDSDQEAETQSIATTLQYEIGATLPFNLKPSEDSEIVVAVGATVGSTVPAPNSVSDQTQAQPNSSNSDTDETEIQP